MGRRTLVLFVLLTLMTSMALVWPSQRDAAQAHGDCVTTAGVWERETDDTLHADGTIICKQDNGSPAQHRWTKVWTSLFRCFNQSCSNRNEIESHFTQCFDDHRCGGGSQITRNCNTDGRYMAWVNTEVRNQFSQVVHVGDRRAIKVINCDPD